MASSNTCVNKGLFFIWLNPLCSSSVSYSAAEDNKRSLVLIQPLCPTSRLHISNRANVCPWQWLEGGWERRRFQSERLCSAQTLRLLGGAACWVRSETGHSTQGVPSVRAWEIWLKKLQNLEGGKERGRESLPFTLRPVFLT